MSDRVELFNTHDMSERRQEWTEQKSVNFSSVNLRQSKKRRPFMGTALFVLRFSHVGEANLERLFRVCVEKNVGFVATV